MSDSGKTSDLPVADQLAPALEAGIRALVQALVQKDEEQYESEFVHLLARVRELVERKLRMEGTKTDTRDFLGELLFTRLRRGMHLFLKSEDSVTSMRAAEWVMGALFSVTTLSEFAKAPAPIRLAVEMAATATDVAMSIHPHPTLSETVMESADAYFGTSTHIYRPKKR